MKRLIFSDLHLHEWSYGAKTLENGFNSRLWSQKEALQQVIDTCKREEIEYVYFTGDFFHTPGQVSTQALQIAGWFFSELKFLGIKFRGLVGNHDMANKEGNIHALSFREGIIAGPGFHIEIPFDGYPESELRIHMMGYTQDEEKIKQFLELAGESGGMILMHQGVSGVPLASGYVIDERLTPEMIPDNCRAFTGHYHFHKTVSRNLTVVGNLTAHNWNDIDQPKGFVIWDDYLDTIEWRPVNAPEFITYYNDIFVDNKFVKYMDEVTKDQAEEIRAELISNGALTVEFPKIKVSASSQKEFKSDVFDIDEYLRYLSTDMEPRRAVVGQELREKTYGS